MPRTTNKRAIERDIHRNIIIKLKWNSKKISRNPHEARKNKTEIIESNIEKTNYKRVDISANTSIITLSKNGLNKSIKGQICRVG